MTGEVRRAADLKTLFLMSLLQNSDARVPIDRQREAATTGNGGSFRLRVKYSRV